METQFLVKTIPKSSISNNAFELNLNKDAFVNTQQWDAITETMTAIVSPQQQLHIFKKLKQIAQNMLKNDKKYRRLDLNNLSLQRTILSCNGGIELLYNLGFESHTIRKDLLICQQLNKRVVNACLACLQNKIASLNLNIIKQEQKLEQKRNAQKVLTGCCKKQPKTFGGNGIIKEGYLQKQSAHLKKYRDRWMVLKGNLLYSYKKHYEYARNGFEQQATEIFNLALYNEIRVSDVKNAKQFEILATDINANTICRAFLADSVFETIEWVKCIDNVQKKLRVVTAENNAIDSDENLQKNEVETKIEFGAECKPKHYKAMNFDELDDEMMKAFDDCCDNLDSIGIGMDKSSAQFYNFLKGCGLEKYFNKFEENECCHIGDIEYFVSCSYDEEFIEHDIGIKESVEKIRFLTECNKMKHKMDEFKNLNIPSIILKQLAKYGIVTVETLCNEIRNRKELKEKVKIDNDRDCDLLWNIIQTQND